MVSEVKQAIDRFIDNFLAYMLLDTMNIDFSLRQCHKLLKVFKQKHTKDTIINLFHLIFQPSNEPAHFDPIILRNYKVNLKNGFGLPISIDEQLEFLQILDEVDIDRFSKAFAKQLEFRLKEIEK